jgi:dynein heavy chain 2
MLLANVGVSTSDAEQAKGGKGSKFKGEDLVKSFLAIHDMCSDKDAAPRRYMTFVKNYKAIFTDKRDGVVKRQQHLQVCLLTLCLFVNREL